MALLVAGEGSAWPPGTRPGTAAAAERGAAAHALCGAGALTLVGEAVRELGVGAWLWGAEGTVLGCWGGTAFGAVRTRLAVSIRRREAGDPGRR